MFGTNKANPEYLYAAILRPIRTVKTNMAYSNSTSCFLSLIVMAALTYTCHCADPDPLQDFCVADLNSTNSVNGFPCKPVSQVSSSDFFFNGLSKEGDTSNIFGSSVTSANVLSFPGLNTQGLSMNRVDFAPGGVNAPHVHPRSSETGIVIKGKLLVGFITTNNVFYSKVMEAGEMFVIPRGLVHFQQNVGSGKAQTFTAFNSQLPGAAVIPLTLFAAAPPIPNSVLTKTFQVDEKVVTKIKSEFGS